jgi:hypothetical protein
MDVAVKTSGIGLDTRASDVAMTYWPFLIAANRFLDYRLAICPDFIEESACKHLFRTKIDLSFDDEPEGKLRFQEITDERAGKLSLFHKFTWVRQGEAVARDSCGRPLARVFGIVMRGEVDRRRLKSADAERLIDELMPTIDAAFDSFWSGDDRGQTSRSAARAFAAGRQAGQPQETGMGGAPATPPRRAAAPTSPGSKRAISVSLSVAGLLQAAAVTVCFAVSLAAALWCRSLDARLAATDMRLIATQRSLAQAEAELKGLSRELTALTSVPPKPEN